MNKVFTPRFLTVLAVTAICLYLTYPTFRYFAFVGGMDDPPTVEQRQTRDEMLENPRVIKLGLDLQGGADFLFELELQGLMRRYISNERERLRSEFAREDVLASVTRDLETSEVTVTLEDPADLDYATRVIEDMVKGGDTTLEPVGNIRQQLAQGKLVLIPRENMVSGRVREAMDGALEVVRKRVDEFGLTQPVVKKAGIDRIRVQIPGENKPERILESLLKTAEMEFRLLHPQHDQQIVDFIEGGANGFLSGAGTGRIRQDLMEEVLVEATGKTVKHLKANIPGVPAGYTLKLGRFARADPKTGLIDDSTTITDLVYLVSETVPLTGDNLRRASVYTDPTDFSDPIKVSLGFDSEGASIFCNITEANVGKRFAIILDNVVYSAPTIQTPICGGTAQISGGFTQQEAHDLSTILKAGALPAPLQAVSMNTIGPSLGADSIRDTGKAIIIGGILIMIMMVVVYRSCGAIAVCAMLLNVLLILGVLSLMGATLTLSGIGGILLTMGMAVDANILIYERLREELDAGKPLRAAINAAFGRAYVVIFDSNITSLLPALVLVLFEVVEGTAMKGFWTAIAIGLLANLYTGIVVTRTLAEAWYAQFKKLSPGNIWLLKNAKIPWMKYRAVGLSFSGALVLASVVYLGIKGPSYGIDFTGGVMTVVQVKEEIPQSEMVGMLEDEFNDVKAIKVVGKDQWQITVPLVEDDQGHMPTLNEIRDRVSAIMQDGLGDAATIMSVDSVEPDIGGEFKVVAVMSLLITCAVILTYVAFRFQWVFGAGAILALVHDVFLALGVFKMLGHTLTLDIVSALLIILGYSVNDTIVVFDRVREKMQDRMSATLEEVMNSGINETLSRTLLTTGSTLLALSVMYFFGGTGLQDFALILILGCAFGSYSSIFIASGLVYTYLKKKGLTTVIEARKATARVAHPRQKARKA